MCGYCEMRPRRSGKLEWLAGDDFEFGDTRAQVAFDDEMDGYLLETEHWDHWSDETYFTFVRIYNCPWCGEDLDAAQAEARKEAR